MSDRSERPVVASAAPTPPDRVVDLMQALQDSVEAAKEARKRHPQPAPSVPETEES